MAFKIDWEPLTYGPSYKVLINSGNRYSFKKTKNSIYFGYAATLITALFLLILFPYLLIDGRTAQSLVIFGIGITVGPILIYEVFGEKDFIIDNNSGLFFRGKNYDKADHDERGKLSETYALQIVSKTRKHTSTNNANYMVTTYELNFVQKTKDRVNIVASRTEEHVISVATIISKDLQIPVWNLPKHAKA